MSEVNKSYNKVSVTQLIMVYIVMTISPSVRFLPAFVAGQTKQASWLSPIATIIPIAIMIYMLHCIFSKHKDMSCSEILEKILGKYAAKLVILFLFIWISFALTTHIRNSGERLVSTIYPNISIVFFITATAVVVAFILHSGAVVAARLGQVLAPILLILFFFLTALLLPKIRMDALLPVYIGDLKSIFTGSLGTLSLMSYLFVIFFFSDEIIDKENTGKILAKGSLILILTLFILLVTTIGILGHSVADRAPIPFLITVKQISILDTIENIESIVIAMWILGDIVLISTFTILCLNLLKLLFNLDNIKYLINILLLFHCIAALAITKHRLELDIISNRFVPYLNIAIGYTVPIILFVVGKIRRKL